MAVLTIGLVSDDSKNDPQMQKQRWQKKFSRHLRITDPERLALRATNRLFQNRRFSFSQQFFRKFMGMVPDLDPIGRPGRAQKQQHLQHLVIVRPGIDAFLF